MDWNGRGILHVDMDAFFASVEQLDHPEWRGRPVVVGGLPETRGVVSAASYEAREYGVRSAMPSARAKRLLPPDAVWAPGRFGRYREMSRKVREVFERFTPYVEPVSIDEAYLDVTPAPGRSEDPVGVARRVRAEIDALGLSCSIGVATSKSVAKVASDHEKPRGMTVVRPGEETAFLAPLPVEALQGVGRATAERLRRLGVGTLGELAALDDATALHVLGSHGPELASRACGVDPRPVACGSPARSASREHTFPRDVCAKREVFEALRSLAAEVCARLRRKGLAGRTVTVKVRYADFTTRTARRTLAVATDLEEEFLPAAEELLRGLWSPGVGLRLLGVGLSGLEEPSAQLDLFEERGATERRRALARGVDAVRARFGEDSIWIGPRRR